MQVFVIDSHREMFLKALVKQREFIEGAPLVIPEEEMIPDAFIEDLKSRAPFKGKNVSLADGFNPPPLKGRKHKYNR